MQQYPAKEKRESHRYRSHAPYLLISRQGEFRFNRDTVRKFTLTDFHFVDLFHNKTEAGFCFRKDEGEQSISLAHRYRNNLCYEVSFRSPIFAEEIFNINKLGHSLRYSLSSACWKEKCMLIVDISSGSEKKPSLPLLALNFYGHEIQIEQGEYRGVPRISLVAICKAILISRSRLMPNRYPTLWAMLEEIAGSHSQVRQLYRRIATITCVKVGQEQAFLDELQRLGIGSRKWN